jgi:hypothetical protein
MQQLKTDHRYQRESENRDPYFGPRICSRLPHSNEKMLLPLSQVRLRLVAGIWPKRQDNHGMAIDRFTPVCVDFLQGLNIEFFRNRITHRRRCGSTGRDSLAREFDGNGLAVF